MPFTLEASGDSRDESRLPFPFPLPLLFLSFSAFPFSRSTRYRIGVDGAARERLPLEFSRSFHAIPCQETVDTFGKPLQCSTRVVFPHPVELDNVSLQLLRCANLRQESVAKHNIKDCDGQTGSNHLPTCVEPIEVSRRPAIAALRYLATCTAPGEIDSF